MSVCFRLHSASSLQSGYNITDRNRTGWCTGNSLELYSRYALSNVGWDKGNPDWQDFRGFCQSLSAIMPYQKQHSHIFMGHHIRTIIRYISIAICTTWLFIWYLVILTYMFQLTCGHLQAIQILQECELGFSYIYSCLVIELSILRKNIQTCILKIFLK
jgi:hypothetical protein